MPTDELEGGARQLAARAVCWVWQHRYYKVPEDDDPFGESLWHCRRCGKMHRGPYRMGYTVSHLTNNDTN